MTVLYWDAGAWLLSTSGEYSYTYQICLFSFPPMLLFVKGLYTIEGASKICYDSAFDENVSFYSLFAANVAS